MVHAFVYGWMLALGLIMPLGIQNVFIFNQGASQRYFIHAIPSVLSAKRQIVFTAAVSLLNPHALLDTVSVIGVNSLQFLGKEKISYTLACILTSWIWFLGLSAAGHFFSHLDPSGKVITIINKTSAFIMWGVAIYLGFQWLKPSFH